MNRKKFEKAVVLLLICVPGLIAVFVTVFLFIFVFWKGKSVISLEFLTEAPGVCRMVLPEEFFLRLQEV